MKPSIKTSDPLTIKAKKILLSLYSQIIEIKTPIKIEMPPIKGMLPKWNFRFEGLSIIPIFLAKGPNNIIEKNVTIIERKKTIINFCSINKFSP